MNLFASGTGERRRSWPTLVALCLLALCVRVWSAVTEPAYLHPDAIWQGIEPAFWLLHGPLEHEVLPWEFQAGVRWWGWPALLSVGMALGERSTEILSLTTGTSVDAAWWTTRAGAGVLGTRLVAALIDLLTLVAIWTAVTLQAGGREATPEGESAASRVRRRAAVAAALVFAAHPVFVVPGAQPLIDVPAAAAGTWALVAARVWARGGRPRAGVWVGLSMGVAMLVRVQLAPALVSGVALAVAWRARGTDLREWRSEVGFVLAGLVGAVSVFVLGDLALGRVTGRGAAPLSWWTGYLQFNLEGGAEAFGSMPADRYLQHAALALGTPLVVLGLGLTLLGGRGAWWVTLPAAAMILSHQLLSYRVWRFIHPALPLILVAAALGGVEVARRVRRRGGPWPWVVRLLVGGTAIWSVVATWTGETLWSTSWLFHQGGQAAVQASRGLNLALLESSVSLASASEGPVRVLQGVVPSAGAPGSAFLGRDVPLVSPLGQRPARWDGEQLELWIVPAGAAAGLAESGWRPLSLSSDEREGAAIRALLSPEQTPSAAD